MLNGLKQLTKLQLMVNEMEQDLGLSGLSHIEKKTLLAIIDLNVKGDGATTTDILAHPMLDKAFKAVTVSCLEGFKCM